MATNAVHIKQEPVDSVDFESKVLELCKETPKGISDSIIQEHLPNITPQQRVKGINRLLSTVSFISISIFNVFYLVVLSFLFCK